MSHPIARHALTRRGTLGLSLGCLFTFAAGPRTQAGETESAGRLAAIEARTGGRLGVAALDSGGGSRLAFRGEERFPMCSTFKFLLAAAILARVDAGRERLDRRVPYGESDLLKYAPVTRAHAGEGGMTVESLCAAAVELSDNTAANLLLQALGGPAAVTGLCRSLGDGQTRLDRIEPALNEAAPGDERDTTTPAAMLHCMEKLLLGDALSPASRPVLERWLLGCKTGTARLPAALPAGARIGHKTGGGEHGTANDIGIVWPAGRKPVLIAVYLTGCERSDAERDAAIADAARVALA